MKGACTWRCALRASTTCVCSDTATCDARALASERVLSVTPTKVLSLGDGADEKTHKLGRVARRGDRVGRHWIFMDEYPQRRNCALLRRLIGRRQQVDEKLRDLDLVLLVVPRERRDCVCRVLTRTAVLRVEEHHERRDGVLPRDLRLHLAPFRE